MPNPGKKSHVWLHFEEEENSAKCVLCGVKISRAAKKAAALQNHLKFKHPGKFFFTNIIYFTVTK